jgi:hypothetical protein
MALTSDHTIGTKSTDEDKPSAPSDGRFWLEALPEDGEPLPPVHVKVVPWSKTLREAWAQLAQKDWEHDTIYENRALRASSRLIPGVRALDRMGFDTSRLFVTTSIVDTFTARIAKRKTMPMFVVDDSEWDLKQKAQDFRRWLHGKMLETGVDRLAPEIVNDACVRGDGVMYIDDGEDDLIVERVHRSELLADPYEAKQGAAAVRTIYRVRQVSRDSLCARFPDHALAIMEAPEAGGETVGRGGDYLADETKIGKRDVVDLVEVWHLPSDCPDDEDEVSDGRVAVCLEGLTLCYQEWRSPRFPFARLSRYKPKGGYWGRGDVELLRGQQAELNRMIADISMNIMVTGKGIWMTSAAAAIQPEQLSGYRPLILSIPGGAPQPMFVHPPPVGQATIDLLERKIRYMHELVGAAQWSVQGKSPLGAGASGIAIDTMEDLLSDRHSVFESDYGHFRLDVAQAMLDAGQRLAARLKEASKGKKRKHFRATWMDKGATESLDWDDVALEGDSYRLQLEPVNFLPTTRAGKLAAVAELVKTGVFSQEVAADMFDEPDIAHHNRVERAPKKNCERMMQQIGRLDRPIPAVEEWHPLEMLLDSTKKYFNRAQAEGAPPEVETRFREFGDMVIATMELQKEKALAAAPPMPGGMPPGAPMPPGAMPPPGMPPDPMSAPMPADAAAGMPLDPAMMPPMAA